MRQAVWFYFFFLSCPTFAFPRVKILAVFYHFFLGSPEELCLKTKPTAVSKWPSLLHIGCLLGWASWSHLIIPLQGEQASSSPFCAPVLPWLLFTSHFCHICVFLPTARKNPPLLRICVIRLCSATQQWGCDQVVCDSMDYRPPGSSVYGILQARIQEWIAISSSRGSSWPRGQTHISCIAGRLFITEPPGKPSDYIKLTQLIQDVARFLV